MIGCDMIEVNRVKKLKNPSRIFTLTELEYANKYSKPYVHLAGFYALKEAVVKAMDVPLMVSQVEVLHDEKGAPYVKILVDLQSEYKIECSISNLDELAMAVAYVEKIN